MYNLLKILLKELIWLLPDPLARVACRLLARCGFGTGAYEVYLDAGRPQTVQSGPFRGMRYAAVSTGSDFMPKLLGTYEKELHEVVESLCDLPCDLLVNVGSAEGYYAVGLTMRVRPTRTLCYDISLGAHRLMYRNARWNAVDSVITAKAWCGPSELNQALESADHPIVVCDIEGGELDLLCPAQVPHLAKAVLLVEIHDFPPPGKISAALQERFSGTHDLTIITARSRTVSDFPCKLNIADSLKIEAMNERRPLGMEWFIFRPKVVAAVHNERELCNTR